MEEYTKLKTIKLEFYNLILESTKIKNDCINEHVSIFNLDNRMNKICDCINSKSKNINEKINNFKIKNNIKEESNSNIYEFLNKQFLNIEELQLKKDFPLSSNSEWLKSFDHYYKLNNNYLLAYFNANRQLLSNEKITIRKLCMNPKTFDGEGYIADDMIKCIFKSKNIIK